ncbi:hypothetical protein FB451DRAFT_1179135 [Mycena latifolia]|nr:hypothetical protein FB451DRAFT_1179135 [Mycena latifolia]
MQLNNPSHYREHTRQQDGWTVLAPPPQETSELPPPYTPLVASGHDWKEAALNVEREGKNDKDAPGLFPGIEGGPGVGGKGGGGPAFPGSGGLETKPNKFLRE